MGLLVECPKCKKRNSPKNASCRCGLQLKKLGHKTYWIEYYDDTGGRKRERVGPSKAAAEQRLREVLKARTEGRYIEKDLATKTTLGELFEWYKTLPDVKSKKTYKKEFSSIKNLLRLLTPSTKIKALTLGKVEEYRSIRLSEPSPRHPGQNVRKSSVNREVSCLMGMLNRAVRHDKLASNPIEKLKKLPENNVRQKILTKNEFERLVEESPEHLKPIVILGFYLGMRKLETPVSKCGGWRSKSAAPVARLYLEPPRCQCIPPSRP